MQTLAAFDLLASAFADMIKKSDSSSEESYRKSLEESRKKVIELIKQFRMTDPILSLIRTYDEEQIEEPSIHLMIEKIAECASKRKGLNLVFTGASSHKVVQREVFNYPKYVDLSKKPHVLIEPYKDEAWEGFAVRMMNQIVLCSLMSLPKGDIRINLVNPSLSNKGNLLIQNLPKNICRSYIDQKEILEFLDSLSERIKDILRNGNTNNHPRYELVVLLDYPYLFDGLTEKMRIIIEQGEQAGIHFIVLNDLRRSLESKQSFDILTLKNVLFQEFGAFDNADIKDYDHILFFTYEICTQPSLMKACFDYLSNMIEEENQILENYVIDYIKPDGGLNVPIGEPIESSKMNFCLGQDGHVHSFIIGQTGTGKSVLLHDIIIEAIQKYSPEDLQIYFLDCKIGGVEFDRYKEIKHARALLVDNSDILMTLEILRDLEGQMIERGKILRDSGVQKIDDYNSTHQDTRMARILVVIDECHVLFEQRNNNERKASSEIINILTKIATEGRSQGVHLIMATQTLANADIPTAILNNITDRYILNCATVDAEKMWQNSSKLTANLKVGDVLYHNTTGKFPDTQFHAYYISQEDIKELTNSAVSKASSHQSNGQFYFNGSQMFHFTQDVIESLSTIRRDNLKACPGRAISLKQSPITFSLKQDMSENVLITGIDEKEQSTRTAMDLLFSLIACNTKVTLNYQFYVFDFKDDEESEYIDVLEQLEKEGKLTLVRKRDMGSLLKRYVEEIKSGEVEPSVFLLLSQQRFRELKLDAEIDTTPKNVDAFGSMNFSMPQTKDTTIKTYKDALDYILDNGPDNHVHTILQVDKPDNLLFEDYVTSKFVFRKFRHLILLRSDEKVAMKLGLPDDIRLENLNSAPERLRAIYYADGDEGWTLFSPFIMPDKEIITSITNKEE